MRISTSIKRCAVKRCSDAELAWLNEYLSIPDVSFVNGRPRTVVRRYFDVASKSFAPGLLKLVRKSAERQGFTVDIVDNRVRPEGKFITPPKFRVKTPHPYQLKAARKAYAAELGMIEIGTAGGKSFIATICFASVPFRCLYVVSAEQLAEQAAEEFELETGELAGRVYSGRFDISHRVVFATFATLWAHMKKDCSFAEKHLSDFQWLIVDEAHEVSATTFNAVAGAVTAFFRTGMSATPLARSDGKQMGVLAATGPLVYRKPLVELAQEGYVALPAIRMVRYVQEAFIGQWQKAYKYQVVRDEGRNALIARIAASCTKPGLVLFNDKDHGGFLLRALTARGIRAERIDGSASVAQRKVAARKLNDGELDILISSRIFRTGVNIKNLGTVINAAGRKSEKEVVQGMGRGARTGDDGSKTTFTLYDVLDTAADERSGKGRWISDHAKMRLKYYLEQGFDVQVSSNPRGPWSTVKRKPKQKGRK